MPNKEEIQFSGYFKHGKLSNRIFLECFKGFTKVTKESCCYGYLTKSQMNIFGNGMPFVLVKTEMEYLNYIQS